MDNSTPISLPESPLRVRFAPSPTGTLHIGGARTALYNWLAARGTGGTLILRIEDTDRERSTDENIEQILDAMRWLGLDWDEGPHSQFERAARHRECLDQLLGSGAAYRDTAGGEEVRDWKAANDNRGYRGEPSGEAGTAVRLRVPEEGATIVDDRIRGQISFENRLQDDPVIARADGSVLYNFAVAIDDADMGISDVIRGDDHLSNTPKQLLVFEALGIAPPRYAHLPLLHGPDGKKLSKRHGAASVQELREDGYLPAAVRNYLALLGWGTTDDTTLMSTSELVERFSIDRVGTTAAIFDEQKLRWVNGRFIREQPLEAYEAELAAHLGRTDPEGASAFAAATPEQRREACRIVQDKAQTVTEIWPLIGFLFTEPADDPQAWEQVMSSVVKAPLQTSARRLRELQPFDVDTVEHALRAIAQESKLKPKLLLQPIRVAISGSTVSPGIFESVVALGRERAVERIEAAAARL